MYSLAFKMMNLKGAQMQTWNKPRHLGADPRPTDKVQLVRKLYSVKKRLKKH